VGSRPRGPAHGCFLPRLARRRRSFEKTVGRNVGISPPCHGSPNDIPQLARSGYRLPGLRVIAREPGRGDAKRGLNHRHRTPCDRRCRRCHRFVSIIRAPKEWQRPSGETRKRDGNHFSRVSGLLAQCTTRAFELPLRNHVLRILNSTGRYAPIKEVRFIFCGSDSSELG
jgi:hypothetical protein